jgi:hypothetical protein
VSQPRDPGPRAHPGVHRLVIRDLRVRSGWFAGASPSFESAAPDLPRVLDRASIRRSLPRGPHLAHGQLYARFTTFDPTSPMDLPVTRLDRRGLRVAEEKLLAGYPGGSSDLGPALRSSEQAGFDGRRLLVVMSDFEIFPEPPTQVIPQLVASNADDVLALVFRSPPPPALLHSGVRVAHIVWGVKTRLGP